MATEKKMTAAEIKEISKANVLDALRETLEKLNVEMVGNIAYIPQTIGDTELWVEVKLTAKQYIDTTKSPAFDPFVARQAYEEEMEIKRKEKEEKEKAKTARKRYTSKKYSEKENQE